MEQRNSSGDYSTERVGMTVSTENATPQKSTKSRNSNSSVQLQIKQSQFEFVPRDTKVSEFLDFVDVGDVAFSVDTVTLHVGCTAVVMSCIRDKYV